MKGVYTWLQLENDTPTCDDHHEPYQYSTAIFRLTELCGYCTRRCLDTCYGPATVAAVDSQQVQQALAGVDP